MAADPKNTPDLSQFTDNVPEESGLPNTVQQKSNESREKYLKFKSDINGLTRDYKKTSNAEDFFFNPENFKSDDDRSVLGHVYDRMDSPATPISTSIKNAKERDQLYRDVLTEVFKDKKTEYFKYGIYIDDAVHHEDPTVLGFDLVIDTENSPLFKELPEYFKAFDGISEIKNRKAVYDTFILELKKYFELDMLNGGAEFTAFKSHYIKSVSGLDNLVESISGGSFDEAGKKQFIDYGKDLIKLNLYEDVTLSTSHLAFLYKTLSWSKINGRLIIPENLLRFDMFIQISEIRNFNTVKKKLSSDSGAEILDICKANVSKYVYKLYDCQFFFDKLPHSDQVGVGDTKFVEGFDLSIKYKFSTVQFERFMQQNDMINHNISANVADLVNRTPEWTEYLNKYRTYLTNEDILPMSVKQSGYGSTSSGTVSSEANSTLGNRAEYLIKQNPLEPEAYMTFSPQDERAATASSNLQQEKNDDEKNKKGSVLNIDKKLLENELDKIKKQSMDLAKRIAQQKANEAIGLLNSSLNKILNKAGLGKIIKDPDNVYDPTSPIVNMIKSEFRKYGNTTINSILGVGQNELKNLFKR